MRRKRTGRQSFLALLCSLLLVLTSLPLTATADSSDSTVVWSLDTSKMGVPGTVADGEYLQGTDGSYQPGIQIADKGNSSMQMYASGVLGINPSGGQYKAINIQTGTAVGGTNYYTNNGFIAAADKEYTVTFSVYVASGNGEVRVRGNQKTATNDDWESTSIGVTPVAASYTWTQSATGGNLQIDTGSTAQGTIVYLTDLQITTPDTTPPVSDTMVVAYDLQEDAGLKDIDDNAGTSYLTRAGSPALKPISNTDGSVALEISNRANSWDGIDVKAAALGLAKDAEFSIELAGHIPDGVTIPSSAQITVGLASDPYTGFKSVDAAADFTLSYEGVWDSGTGLRIQASEGISVIVIDRLIIKAKGGIEMPSKPLPTVPGVVIAQNGQNGASYTGATIVLGTDNAVWPFATNSQVDDPVAAFMPEKDATYHLTFNVTSNGTQGFRVRWYNDVGYDPHTAADALHVNDNVYTADETATKVPAYFQNTIEQGETKDFAVDFTMSGSEGADGLVGNIGIRGQFGSHDFTVNSLRITDDDDNVLVKWSNSDDPFVPDDYVWPESKWNLTLPSLKDAYSKYFLIGNILGWGGNADAAPWGQENDQADKALKDASIISQTAAMFKAQYNAVTPENIMKPENISKAKDAYDYTVADKLIAWAKTNKIAVHGHTLVWHQQSPAWLNKAEAANRASAKANLESYIANVAGHFKGQVISWDVVNEAFSDNTSTFDGSDWTTGLRKDSPWYIAYANGADADKGESGADYIYDAFAAARLTDPGATLYYNDYNETYKYEQIAQMAESLNAKWATDSRNTDKARKLVEGIGMQSHFWVGQDPDVDVTEIETTIQRFIQAGVTISVSELDIPFAGNNNYHLDEAKQAQQAELYGTLFGIYKKYASHIDRVTFWGKADIQSWRGSGMPVLFDNSYRPKAAFWKVIGLGAPAENSTSDDDSPAAVDPNPAQPGEVKAEVDTNGNAKAEFKAEDVKKALAEAKAGTMKLQVQGVENAKRVAVSIPGDQVKAAKEAGIKRIEIAAGLASVQLPVSLFEGAADNANVELNVAKVDNSTLSDAQRALVGSNTVFDFDLSVDGKKITDFSQGQPVKVAVPYTLKPGENPGQIVIYYLSDDGKLEAVKNGRYNKDTGTVEFNAKHFSKYAAIANPVTFNDLKAVASERDSIEGLAARGIVGGMKKDTFAPSNSATRAEFIQMLMSTLDLNQANATSTFTDAKPGAWYYNAVASAQQLGIVSGLTDGSFGINNKITRQEMAAMAYRAIQKAAITLNAEQAAAFQDVQDIAGYAKEAVTAMHQAGIINDAGNGTFNPQGTATRAEAAVILYQLLMKSL